VREIKGADIAEWVRSLGDDDLVNMPEADCWSKGCLVSTYATRILGLKDVASASMGVDGFDPNTGEYLGLVAELDDDARGMVRSFDAVFAGYPWQARITKRELLASMPALFGAA
jgi:hypothetical protein